MRTPQLFWRAFAVACLAVAGYAAHGLNMRASRLALAAPLPAAATAAYSPWIDGSLPAAVTQSADGKTLYFWGPMLRPNVPSPAAQLEIQAEYSVAGAGAAAPDPAAEGRRQFEALQAQHPSVDLAKLYSDCYTEAGRQLGPNATPAQVAEKAGALWQTKIKALPAK